jgi:hypothetical protein
MFKVSGDDDIPTLRLTRHTGSTPEGDVMPTMRRTHDPARPSPTPAPRVPLPHHEISLPARLRRLVTPSRENRPWPVAIAVIALIVFIVSWAQTTVLMALILALATLVAGAVLLTLMFGPAWMIQPRRLTPRLRRNR